MKNIKNILSLLFLSQITITPVIGQNSGKTEYINVKSCVTDAQGKPVKGAKVYVDGNFGSTVTDASGRFALKVKPTDRLYIKSEGYLSKTVSAKDVDSKIDMDETPYLQGEDNQVDLGFIKVDKRDVNSDITTVKTSDIDGKYNPRGITDILNGNVSGMANYNNVRGLGNALVVVDGVIRYDAFSSAMMMPEEIESVTVLKDVAAVALFGSQARNGAILIQTKHGNAHERSIRINARYGINDPKALPQYLNSADYMTLYNEARTNDGLSPLYSDQTIENYRSGNPYRYPSVDYYSSDYLKSVQTNSRVSADFTGGDKNVSYYANLGWSHDGSWINFGDAKSQGTNRFNLRTNVDFRINDFIKNSVSANAVFNFSKGPRTDYFSNASTLKPNAYTPFLPISLLDETNTDMMNLVSIERNVIGGTYILGGTSSIKTNPFADIYAGGYNETINRVMEINDRIDVDLNALTKGLSFVGNIGFDFYNRYQQYVSNGYAVYVPTWDTNDKITALTKYNDNTYTGVQYVGSPNFYRRLAFSGMLNYERSFADVHHLSAQLIASGSNYTVFTPNNNGNASDPWPEKNTHLGMRVAYDYKKTYYADFSSALQYSTKLASGHRLGFSPTIALGWTIRYRRLLLL
jgi:TonB-dependent SusC/RagA subfamily outer membrane receptor